MLTHETIYIDEINKGIRTFIGSRKLASLSPCLILLILCGMIGSAAFAQQIPEQYAANEIIVKFKANIPTGKINALNAVKQVQVKSVHPKLGYMRLEVPDGQTVEQFLEQYRQNPNVQWAEPNYIYHLSLTPNDPGYSNQQAYYNLILAQGAWEVETGDSNLIIAVIDSGVDLDNPDLAANIWSNSDEIDNDNDDDDGNGYEDDIHGWDFVGADPGTGANPDSYTSDNNPDVFAGDASVGNDTDDDSNGAKDDNVAHGTFVASIAAAVGNNGIGVAGACWNCKIMALRVFPPDGGAFSSDIADAITYAAENGAKVINLSLGSDTESSTITAAINTAYDTYGAVIVAAAGNANTSAPHYPAATPNAVAVGASDRADGSDPDGRASFSNWGAHIDVVAPGVRVYSYGVKSVADGNAGEPFLALGNGTSFSAPLVSGLAALVLSKNPSWTPEQVRSSIKSAASNLPNDPDDDPDAEADWDGAGLVQFATTDSLPVELSNFIAVATDDRAVLRWRTETEVNNVGFSIYRRAEGDDTYTEIAFVKGAGNSGMPHDYQFTDKEVEAGKTYFYYLEDIDITGEEDKSRIVEVAISSAKPPLLMPSKCALLQNFPNPFNPETWLPYQLAEDAPATIQIYDQKGQLIRALNLGNRPAGIYLTRAKAAYWDGKNTHGERVSSGMYFYTLQAGEFSATRKLVITK